MLDEDEDEDFGMMSIVSAEESKKSGSDYQYGVGFKALESRSGANN